MRYSGLREFVEVVEEEGELRRVGGAKVTEIGSIAAMARMTEGSPAVLFDSIEGYPEGFRVFANNINTPTRVAIALGLDIGLSRMEILRSWKDKRKSIDPMPTRNVSDALFTKNTQTKEQINVLKFPAPLWHEFDGGRYIGSGSISVMKDPDESWVNVGIYRIQIHDDKTLVIHFDHTRRHGYLIAKKYWDRGLACPIALVCGEDPALFVAASENAPWGVSEFGFAGWLKGEPIAVLQSDATGLPLPANSEIIIEGDIPPPEQITQLEGPFGEATGYYAGERRRSPIIAIKRIMHRDDPILSGNPPLRPPYHASGVPLDAALLWQDLEKAGIAVSGIWKPSRWVTVVSICQKMAGEVRRVGEIAVRSRGVYLDRVIVVMDDDLDPTNPQDLLWAISTRCEPATGISIYPNLPGSTIDPLVSPERSSKGDFTHSKVVIDACKPFEWKDRFPRTNDLSEATKKDISKHWQRLLLG